MENLKIDELQKLYDNKKVGDLVQEICEYYATGDAYEDNSFQEEIEPPELVESVYLLFCLQSREQILDEFALIRKKYPNLYASVESIHNTLLVNMDYRALEDDCCRKISAYAAGASKADVLSHAESTVRTSENLSGALDKFYTWLHSLSS